MAIVKSKVGSDDGKDQHQKQDQPEVPHQAFPSRALGLREIAFHARTLGTPNP